LVSRAAVGGGVALDVAGDPTCGELHDSLGLGIEPELEVPGNGLVEDVALLFLVVTPAEPTLVLVVVDSGGELVDARRVQTEDLLLRLLRQLRIAPLLADPSASSLMRCSTCFCCRVCGSGMYSPFETIWVGTGERKSSFTTSSAGVTFVSCSSLNHESASRESGAHFDMFPSAFFGRTTAKV